MTLCLFLVALVSKAQSGQVKGQLTDSTATHPLADAIVSLLNGKDSSLASTAFTDKKGSFNFTGIATGSYRVYITYLGYQPVIKSVNVTAEQPVVDMGSIHLKGKGINLNVVEIVQEAPPVVVKKDTLEFNADAFKTRENAVVEDLIKKLPGVTVDKDGVITAQGETVKRVLVDGKPFFGDDPKLATKNLPAEVIDKIQVIDRKSDQAQFTGIDDGNIEKTINITIKKDKKKGVFGKASAGYGTDDRYAINANANAFRDNRQLSFLGSGNNVNNMGFTQQDVFNFSSSNNGGGGSNGRSGGGGRGAAQSTISSLGGNSTTGIQTNWNAGFNYNQDFSSKLKINGSYFINDVKTENKNQSARQTFTPNDSTYYYNSTSGSVNESKNNRLNMRIEYEIDSFHSLIVTPTLSYTNGNSQSTSYYQQLDKYKVASIDGSNLNSSTASSPNFGGSALYRQKFRKKGRTLSANFTFGYNTTDRKNYFKTADNYIATDTTDAYTKSYDRKTDANNLGRNYGATFTYTEPIMKDRFLEANYSYSNNYSSSRNLTYDANEAGKYENLNDSLSNIFENTFEQHQAGVNIRTNKLKYDYTIGMNVRFNTLLNDNVSRNTHIEQHTVNYFPSATFNYNFEQGRRLRFRYNGSTSQPTISQLQPLPDLTNSLYVQQGNPDLKPAFTHNVQLGYNAFNRSSFKGIFANLNASLNSNQIVNANRIDTSGKQYTKPINASGVYSVSGNMVNTIPIKNHVTSLNINTNLSYKRDASYTGLDVDFADLKKYYTKNFSWTEGLTFNYFYKELFDVSTSGSVQYSAARYDILPGNNTNYFNYALSVDFNVNLPLGFQIGSDMTYTLNAGRAPGYNVNYTLLNGYVSKFVGKNKQGQFKLYGYDLLKQNISISRTTGENYIQDTQNMVLQRYFMISFTYFLRKFGAGGNNNSNREGPPPGMRFGRPPGGGGGFPRG